MSLALLGPEDKNKVSFRSISQALGPLVQNRNEPWDFSMIGG